MPQSNRLCRWFLFDIVPRGKKVRLGSTGESHDRIGLRSTRVRKLDVTLDRVRSRDLCHTRLSLHNPDGERFLVSKIDGNAKSCECEKKSEDKTTKYIRTTNFPGAYNAFIPFEFAFNTRSDIFHKP